MEPGNPALDDYVRTLAPAREPRICLLPTAGGDSEDQIRRFHADVRRPAVRADARLAVPARRAPRAAARAPARAGRDLRRRRLDDQPARALARARARRDPARGVAGRHRARRAERRLDVLVRVGRHEVASGGRRSPAGSASCPARTPSTTTASRSAARSTSTRSRAATRPPGWGVDDGVGLLFRGTRLAEVVASRPGARALPRARGRRRGGRGGDRAAAAQGAGRTPTRRRRSRSSELRALRRARGGCWTGGRCGPGDRPEASGRRRDPLAPRARARACAASARRGRRGSRPVAESGSAATSSGVPAAIR